MANYQTETPPHPTPQTDPKVCSFVGHPWTRTGVKSAPTSSTITTTPRLPREGANLMELPLISSEFKENQDQDTQVTVDISDLDLKISTSSNLDQNLTETQKIRDQLA